MVEDRDVWSLVVRLVHMAILINVEHMVEDRDVWSLVVRRVR